MRNLDKLVDVLKENTPTILSVIGASGVISTAAMAVKATPKAMVKIEDAWKVSERNLTKLDYVKVAWRLYVPSVLMAATSIAAILTANALHLQRNAALVGLYSLTELALREYQDKVVEVLGEKKAGLVREGLAEDKLAANPVETATVMVTPNGNFLFLESLSGRYFRSSVEAVNKVFIGLNYAMISGDQQSLNDLYFDLGLEPTELGGYSGWDSEDGPVFARYDTKMASNDEAAIVIGYTRMPKPL